MSSINFDLSHSDRQTALSELIDGLQSKADQLAYLAGLKSPIVLLDVETGKPLPKYKGKKRKASAKARIQVLISTVQKIQSIVDSANTLSQKAFESKLQEISDYYEQVSQITANLHQPLPTITAKVHRVAENITPKKKEKVSQPATQEPSMQKNETVEIASGFPMLAATQVMLKNELWQQGERGEAIATIHASSDRQNRIDHVISDPNNLDLLPWDATEQIRAQLGFDTAKLQIILAAEAVQCDRPWEERFTIKGSDLIKLMGKDRNKRSTKAEQLSEIASIAWALRSIVSCIFWTENRGSPQEKKWDSTGQLWMINVSRVSRDKQLKLFEMEEPNLDVEEIYLEVTPGQWTSKFLNREGSRFKEAMYQYGYTAQSILKIDPYHDELALRMALYLTLNSRSHMNGRYKVETLLSRVMPTTGIQSARNDSRARHSLTSRWINALKLLSNLGWLIEYGDSYPNYLKVGKSGKKETGYFQKLLNAIITIKPEWQDLLEFKPREQAKLPSAKAKKQQQITADQIRHGRKARKWTQSELAGRMNVKQPVISYWERGTRQPTKDQEQLLITLLNLSPSESP